MADIINEPNKILDQTAVRLEAISSNYVSISTNTNTITLSAAGVANPTSFIATPSLNGQLRGIEDLTWTVTPNTITYSVNATTKVLTIAAADAPANTVITATASLTFLGTAYTKSVNFNKIVNTPTAELTLTSIGVPADSSGNVLSFFGATTTMNVYVGNENDSTNWTYSVTKTNVTTSEATTSRTQTVTGLSANIGYIDFVASKTGFTNLTKRFTITKQTAGAQGAQGLQGIQGPKGDNGQDGQDGQDGLPGIKTFSGLVYYTGGTPTGNSATAPSTSTNDLSGTYNFSTNTFSSLSANWSLSAPIFQAGNDYKYWYSRFTVVESSSGSGSGTASFSPASQTIGFSGLVTFSSATPTTLTTSSGNTFNYTAIDGGSITTGIIKSANYSYSSGNFSTAGTQFDLSSGLIRSKSFLIDGSGNATFAGTLEAAKFRTKNPTGQTNKQRIELNWDDDNLIEAFDESDNKIISIGRGIAVSAGPLDPNSLQTILNSGLITLMPVDSVTGYNQGISFVSSTAGSGDSSPHRAGQWLITRRNTSSSPNLLTYSSGQYGQGSTGSISLYLSRQYQNLSDQEGDYSYYFNGPIGGSVTTYLGNTQGNVGTGYFHSVYRTGDNTYRGWMNIGQPTNLVNGIYVSINGGIRLWTGIGYGTVLKPVTNNNAEIVLTLPTAYPTSNDQALVSTTTGTLSWATVGTNYTLPTASATTLGGIKVGTRLSIDANGVLSADVQSTSYTLPLAASGTRGGVQIGYVSTGKNYAVQLDASEKMYVNVPWTDTDTVYSLPLAASGTRGGVQVGYTTTGRNYAVQLSGEQMYVNVPWTDTDTDTVTRLRGTTTGTFASGDVTLAAGSNVSINQVGTTITINSSYTDTDTVTNLRAGTGDTYINGNITFVGSGATTVSRSGNTITISSTDNVGSGADGNTYVTSASFSGGSLTLTRNDNVTVSVSLDGRYLTSVSWTDVTGKPSFATVATSGSYTDLTNKPTIPAAQIQSDWNQSTITALDYIKNKPTLFSGSYNDLTNKPTIPAAQIQSDWDQSTITALDYIKNKPTIPTNTNQLTNGAGFYKSGDSMSTGNLTVTGSISATGEITAYSSDNRLKTNIESIVNAIDKLKQLNGVTYNWNALANTYGFDTTVKQAGLLAQEVQAVLPEAVKPAPFDINEHGNSRSGENYITIQYEKLIPLLVEAIKEQQTQIDQLKRLLETR